MLALSLCLAACLALGAPASALTGKGTWNHLGTNGGSPGPALNGQVSEMYATANTMYVGGSFTSAGGIPAADRIAKWNGNSWSAVGPTIASNGSVLAIAVHGGKVYAGGSFINAGDEAAADYLSVFDGVSWQPFCNTTSPAAFEGNVQALQVIGSELFIGGTFQNANGIAAADYLVACDLNSGEMRTIVDDPIHTFSGPINDLAATSDGTLYAGGSFTNVDDIPSADNVASYKGNVWSSLGSTPIGTVHDLHANGMNLYVSSAGEDIGGNVRSDHLVKWNGNAFSPVGGDGTGNGYFPAGETIINELTTSGSLLFAAGSWQNAAGAPTGDMLAYFDGSKWRPLGSNGAGSPQGALNDTTEALAVFGGQVFAGGEFTSAGGDPKANFAASRSLKLPDASIAGTSGADVGNNVYNSTAAGQSKTLEIPRGTNKTFRIVVHNDGISPATFKLKGAGAARGYSIKYVEVRRGKRRDITSSVKRGTYMTPTVPETTGFRMDVVVKLSSRAARKGSFVVKASSMPNHPVDAVKGVVNAK
jgi:hypothetical protein